MARKRRSGLEGLIVVMARLPWWLSLVLGAGLYVGLNQVYVATLHPPKVSDLSQSGSAYVSSLIHGITAVGRYLLPAACGIGALLSLINLLRGKLALLSVKVGGVAAVGKLSWRDFERLCREALRERGFAVAETGEGADGGVDLRATRAGRQVLVQCKHWPRRAVDVKVVRELHGVVSSGAAVSGMVITSGHFTGAAREFATRVGMELWDSDALEKLRRSHAPEFELALEPHPGLVAGACPQCGGDMTRRTARRGSRAGQSFLGCRRYPACRGTRELA